MAAFAAFPAGPARFVVEDAEVTVDFEIGTVAFDTAEFTAVETAVLTVRLDIVS